MKYYYLFAAMILWPMFQTPKSSADLLMLPSLDNLPAAPAELPNRDAVVQSGFANKATSVDEPMRIVVSEKDPANLSRLIERDIAVTDIPKFERPTQNVGETARAFVQRAIAAQEAHSKLKAVRVAAAINTTLGNGRATATQSTKNASTGSTAWNRLVPGDLQATQIKNGQFDVTGAHKITYGPSAVLIKTRDDEIRAAKEFNKKPENINNQIPVPKPLANNHTGEIGDGVQFKNGTPPPSPGTSPRSRGMIGTMNYDLARDYPGEFPGLPSTYDSFAHILSLDGLFDENTSLFWTATDTGLSDYLTVSWDSSDIAAVPEPSTVVLVSVGIASLTWLSRRRRNH
ncbi:MAG: PEP-CTERM sorting domain-containing protein [Pirellulaceae bacterium]|nr:PEP-CTERM sorting domain-containing protein [Pirellulaceae bacterium]